MPGTRANVGGHGACFGLVGIGPQQHTVLLAALHQLHRRIGRGGARHLLALHPQGIVQLAEHAQLQEPAAVPFGGTAGWGWGWGAAAAPLMIRWYLAAVAARI